MGKLLFCSFSPWFHITVFQILYSMLKLKYIKTIFILNSFCICILVAYRRSIFNMPVVLTVGTEITRANHLDLFVHPGSRRKCLRVNSVLFTAGNRTFLCDLLAHDSLRSPGSQTWYYKSWASEVEHRSTLVTHLVRN